jgi:hypothetical protein
MYLERLTHELQTIKLSQKLVAKNDKVIFEKIIIIIIIIITP